MLSFLSAVIGLGSGIASAIGSSRSAGAAEANVGLGMAAAHEKALGYELKRDEAMFAATLSKIQGDLGSDQIKTNAQFETTDVTMSAYMQKLLKIYQGKVATMRADLQSEGYGIQAKRAGAVGQQEMQEIFENTELLESDLVANAAAAGFVVDDNSSIGVSALAEDIYEEGMLQGRRAYARRAQDAADLEYSGAIATAEGRMADVVAQFEGEQAWESGKYTANAIQRKANLEAYMYRGNKQLESMARTIEASNLGQLASTSMQYGAQVHMSELAAASSARSGAMWSAGATLLGSASTFALDVHKYQNTKSNAPSYSQGAPLK